MHFVKLQIFTLISIRFTNFWISTSISIHITRKLKILRVQILWLLYPNHHMRNCQIRKLFSWFFAYNSLICWCLSSQFALSCIICQILFWLLLSFWGYKTFYDEKRTFFPVFPWHFGTQFQSLLSYDLHSLHKTSTSHLWDLLWECHQ